MTTIGLLAAVVFAASLILPVETLDDGARTFPADAAIPRSIFVVTLSKAASEQGTAWTRRLRERASLTAPVFQVAVLEDVPRLFRGTVVSALSKQVPPALRDQFWIAVTASDDWRAWVDSSADAEAHVLVLDDRREVIWRAHGAVTDDKIADLQKLPPPGTR